MTLSIAEAHDLMRVSRMGLSSSLSVSEPELLLDCECPKGVKGCCGLCPGTISEPCCTINEEDDE